MQYAETKTKQITIAEIKKSVLSTAQGYNAAQKRGQCMILLSALLQQYRYEIFSTYDGFKIVNNGYGSFICIEMNEGSIFTSEYILSTLEHIDNTQDIKI